jgi:hypothetical protein
MARASALDELRNRALRDAKQTTDVDCPHVSALNHAVDHAVVASEVFRDLVDSQHSLRCFNL